MEQSKPQKVAYIAGPFRSATRWGVAENIHRAEQVALKYWKLGYAVVTPHMNTGALDGLLPDKVFLDADLEIMKRCDVVVAMDTWRDSVGARSEIALAEVLGIPIIYDGNGTSWVRTVSSVESQSLPGYGIQGFSSVSQADGHADMEADVHGS